MRIVSYTDDNPAKFGLAATFFGVFFALPAGAADLSMLSSETLQQNESVLGVSVFIGLVVLTTITALLHLTGRRRWVGHELALTTEIANLRAKLDRAQVFLSAERQIVIAWGSESGEPEIEGQLTLVIDAPIPRRILGFGSWLPPALAQDMEKRVDRLRQDGEPFRMALVSLANRHLEAEGCAVGGRAILRIRDVSSDRQELNQLRDRHSQLVAENDALRSMLNALPDPVWLRDKTERLTWVNNAYVRAVEAKSPTDAVLRHLELLDRPALDASAAARRDEKTWTLRVGAVVAGERRMVSVIDVPAQGFSAGIATDRSELEAARADLERQIESHRATLDKLPTGVAIFDRSKQLVFHNQAYRQIWSLDQAFLDQRPTDGEILDVLRVQHRLPEQTDFRGWKAGVLAVHHSVDSDEQVWHLPDRRSVRVVINPNPQGGVTYLFDDMTERYALKSQYNALYTVQTETLDSLREGVAVFGSDGRIKLSNPAFGAIWAIDATILLGEPPPHIDDIATLCAASYANAGLWSELRSVVSGLHDKRLGIERRRLERHDGSIIDFVAAPLPDGATLLTFADVTDSSNVERALKDRNEALMQAEQLRNDFVKHVSFELRTPLNNIIGFSELIGDPSIGPLNARQSEYAGYIRKSSTALLALINNILDLASIDAGAIELSLGDVDIAETITAATEGLGDRLRELQLQLKVVRTGEIGTFVADGKRIVQILFNLLSNAINFSLPGQTITLAALRREGEVVFKVIDEGRGVPPEVINKVFERFQSGKIGSKRTGAGLGLSIVRSFVMLHGGKVLIDSAPGVGTTVTCIFPTRTAPLLERGEEISKRYGLQSD